MRRSLFRLLPGALLLAVPLAALAAPAAPIELQLTNDPLRGRAVLRAEGVLSDACTPQPARVLRRGHEIVMTLQPTAEACADGPQPFRLDSAALPDPLPMVADGVHRLRLEWQSGPDATPQLEAFALVATGVAANQAIQPETGLWWGEQGAEFDQATQGFGVQLERQAGVLAVSVTGYDDNGQPEWLFGAAPVSGATATIPLGRLQGGRGPYGRFRSPQGMTEAGRLHIEWLGPARAVFWFERPALDGRGIELRPVSMVRFGFGGGSGEPWLGRWLLGGLGEDDATPARAIDFVAFEPRPDGFSLLGAQNERLDCRLDPARPNSPPDGCRLLTDGEPDIDFDRIALGSLRGGGAAGNAVLLRVTR